MNTETTSDTMNQIERMTNSFSAARVELADRMQILQDEIVASKRRRLQGIKNALSRLSEARTQLHAVLEANPELFESPKTRTIHGIRVGWMKQRGKLEIEDKVATLAALRKLYGDKAEAYIRISETPLRTAIADLPAKDLKRLGVEVTDDVDVVVIKPVDSELDKLIAALVGDEDLEAALR